MKKNVLIVVATIFLLSACKNEEKKSLPKTMDELSQYSSMKVVGKEFEVDVPEGWTSRDTVIRNINFYFLYPPATDQPDNTSINIIHEGMQGLNLSSYKQATLKAIKESMPGFELKNDGEITAGKLEGFWFRYTLLVNGNKSELINYTFPSNGVAYIITGGTADNKMEKYKKDFDAIATSFRVKE